MTADTLSAVPVAYRPPGSRTGRWHTPGANGRTACGDPIRETWTVGRADRLTSDQRCVRCLKVTS